jgi:hypothetical protein
LPGYLAQHFSRQPRRGKARRDDRNRFHATSVNFLWTSCKLSHRWILSGLGSRVERC